MSEGASARSNRWLMRVGIALCVLISYGYSVAGRFVDWDDQDLITSNPNLSPPTLRGLVEIWRQSDHQMYIPVVYSAWWGLAHFGMNPHVFHAANVLVHVLSGWVVFEILLLLVGSRSSACAGALLFAVHPLQTEAVAWATGMKDCLSGLLALVAIWQFIRARQINSTKRFALATAVLVLALLAKPSTVCVPLICAVMDRLMLGTEWRRIAQWIAPWLILAVGCAVIASMVQPIPPWLYVPPPAQRIFVAGDSLAWYATKLVWPVRLAVDYSRTPQAVLSAANPWLGLVVVVMIGIVVALSRRRAPQASALIFSVALLPVLGLTPFIFQQYSTVADRYAYLALLGPALVVAYLGNAIRSRWFCIPAGAVCAILVALSVRQTLVWHDTLALFSHALVVNPNSLAANRTLGYYFAQEHDDHRALQFFEKTAELYPDDPANHFNWANLLRRQGHINESIAHYEKAIRARPNDPKISLNYGLALIDAHRPADALAAFTNAADNDPTNADAYQNAGLLLEQMGALAQARQAFAETLKLDPSRAVARRHLDALNSHP